MSCPICNAAHNIYHYEEFIKLPVQSKISKVQKHQLCFNCLRPNHQNKDCTSGNCRKCQKKHNTLLHRDESSIGNVSSNTASTSKEDVEHKVSCIHTRITETPVVLATAIISVRDSQGNQRDCRVLLDGGAQSHFITQDFCSQLGLKLTPINQPVSGLGNQQTNLIHKTDLHIRSKYNAYSAKITCLVIRKITGDMPNALIDPTSLKIPKNLTLADLQFYVSRPIELLIGAKLFWNLLCIGQIPLRPVQVLLCKKQNLVG